MGGKSSWGKSHMGKKTIPRLGGYSEREGKARNTEAVGDRGKGRIFGGES